MRSRSSGESLIVFWYSPKWFAIRSAKIGLPFRTRSIKASRTNSRCLYFSLAPAVIPALTAKNNRQLISSSKRSCPISLEAAVRGRMVLIKLIGRSPNMSWCSCIASSLGVILELVLKKPIRSLIAQSSCKRKAEVLRAGRPGLNRDSSARRDSVRAHRSYSAGIATTPSEEALYPQIYSYPTLFPLCFHAG